MLCASVRTSIKRLSVPSLSVAVEAVTCSRYDGHQIGLGKVGGPLPHDQRRMPEQLVLRIDALAAFHRIAYLAFQYDEDSAAYLILDDRDQPDAHEPAVEIQCGHDLRRFFRFHQVGQEAPDPG